MTIIAKPLQVPNNPDLQNVQRNQAAPAESVGKGALSGQGIVPPSPGKTGEKPDMSNALKSLAAFMSGNAAIDVDVLLVQVAVAMRDTEATTQKSKINTDQETKKAQMREKEHKLEESAKKLEKQQNGSIWEKIKLAFEWLGAMLAVALAVIAAVASLGGATALIVAAIAAVALVIDSTVQQATGQGIMGNIVLAAGGTKEQAAQADMGFKIAVAVIGITGAISGTGLGKAVKDIASSILDSAMSAIGKAIPALAKTGADAVTKGADAAAKTASTLASTADDALNAAKLVAKEAIVAQNMVNTGSTANAALSATSTVVDTGVKTVAADLRADAKRLEAKAKSDEAFMQGLDDMIDQALSRLIASSDRFNAILDEITAAMSDRGNTLSRARFAG
jgi:hypothetical protein